MHNVTHDYILTDLYASLIYFLINCHLNPSMPNLFSHPYQLDELISNFRAVGRYLSLLFKFKRNLGFAPLLTFENSGEPDQTPLFAASGAFRSIWSGSELFVLVP